LRVKGIVHVHAISDIVYWRQGGNVFTFLKWTVCRDIEKKIVPWKT